MKNYNENVYIQLNRSFLFSPLPIEELEKVVTFGNIQNLEKDSIHEFGSKTLGFINVLIDGCLKVRRVNSSMEEEVRDHYEGSAFGSIDNVMSLGHFKSATAIKPSQIFSIHRDSLQSLLSEYPKLKHHFSSMRAQMAMKASVVTKGHREYREESTTKAETPLSYKVAPRYSVWEKRVHIQFPSGKTNKVESVSFNKIWAVGECAQEPNTETSFLVRATTLGYPALELKGTVMRKTKNGFVIQLHVLPEKISFLWDDLLLKAMSLEFVEEEVQKIKKLRSPLQASVSTEGGEVTGELVSLGTEGGVFQTTTPVHQKEFVLLIQMNGKGSVQLEATKLGGNANDYLLGFQRIDSEIRNSILDHLNRDGIDSLPAEVEEEPVEPPRTATPAPEEHLQVVIESSNQPEILKLQDLDALRDFYFTELRNRILHLPLKPTFQIGKNVQIKLMVPLGLKRDLKIEKLPDLGGTIYRLANQMAYVRIEKDQDKNIQAIRDILDKNGTEVFEQDLKNVAAVEHNTQHRRYIQLFLILALFTACLIWLYNNLVD